ncbi:hypothetical protein GCM10023333_42260 [Ferrimonas pelagia]|uniref:Uncharacterized protein n=2 Tax=Ferrimonas pelagia TaxID=1177826 RepID=A0ABP9FPN0_9GAMM
MQCPPLNYQLPYTFENGLNFNGFNAQCSGCHQPIELEQLRGSLSAIGLDRCLLSARGYCDACDGITCYDFILTATDQLNVEPLPRQSTTQPL